MPNKNSVQLNRTPPHFSCHLNARAANNTLSQLIRTHKGRKRCRCLRISFPRIFCLDISQIRTFSIGHSPRRHLVLQTRQRKPRQFKRRICHASHNPHNGIQSFVRVELNIWRRAWKVPLNFRWVESAHTRRQATTRAGFVRSRSHPRFERYLNGTEFGEERGTIREVSCINRVKF